MENQSFLFKTRTDGTNKFGELKYYFLASFLIILFDQLSKRLIENGVIKMNFFYNEGAAMGLLRTLDSSIRLPLFIGISIVALVVIVYYMFTLELSEKMTMLGLALILGGAIGNFIDRIIYGKVLDFIDTGIWPTFNIADSAITVGVILLLFKTIFPTKEIIETPEENKE